MIYMIQILPGKLPICVSWGGLEDAIKALSDELKNDSRDIDCWSMELWQQYCLDHGINDDTMDEAIETNDEYVIIRNDPRFIAPIYHSAPTSHEASIMVYNLWVEFKAKEGTTCISFYSDEDAEDGLNSGWKDSTKETQKVLADELNRNREKDESENWTTLKHKPVRPS